jgi:hypothetical protein
MSERRRTRKQDAVEPLDLDAVRTYPLASRRSKVGLRDLGKPVPPGASIATFLESLPHQLAGETLRDLAASVRQAKRRHRPVLWGLGAHVIKVGLTPVLVDLMDRGHVNGIALNGAGIVHDFELAVSGGTSEDVATALGDGAFGMARETGEELNRAITTGDEEDLGIGAAVGRALERRKARYREQSLLAAAWRRSIPVTVHVALGTDIIHMHPACDPAAVGRASHRDFRLFAALVSRLGGGGVYLNVGSAVLLPEVFLKAVTLARNLGHVITDFTTANLDFLQSYRPTVNVVERPTKGVGRGYRLTGHHELMVPLLAAAIICGTGPRRRSG